MMILMFIKKKKIKKNFNDAQILLVYSYIHSENYVILLLSSSSRTARGVLVV